MRNKLEFVDPAAEILPLASLEQGTVFATGPGERAIYMRTRLGAVSLINGHYTPDEELPDRVFPAKPGTIVHLECAGLGD